MRKLLFTSIASIAIGLIGTAFCSTVEAQWGTLKGQILLDGEIPTIRPIALKGDSTVKDAAVCAAQDLPDEKLVVDPSTKGIANVFVFLAKKPATIHPSLAASTVKEIPFDQKGCRFIPRAMVVRTDQQVRVFSDDEVAHNTHTNPLRSDATNFVINKDRVGVLLKPIKVVEKTPMKVNCDIHNFMYSFWLIIDHPYGAVTNEKGEFEIPNLPVGDHEFSVWQESSGWLNKKYSVMIKEGVNEEKPLKFTAAQILK